MENKMIRVIYKNWLGKTIAIDIYISNIATTIAPNETIISAHTI